MVSVIWLNLRMGSFPRSANPFAIAGESNDSFVRATLLRCSQPYGGHLDKWRGARQVLTMGFGPLRVKAKFGDNCEFGGSDGVRAQPRAIPSHLVSLENR